MNKIYTFLLYAILGFLFLPPVRAQGSPEEITFVRQGVRRMIFDREQAIPLSGMTPGSIIGRSAMHPASFYSDQKADIGIRGDQVIVQSEQESQTGIWIGGFNPFATYTLDLASLRGETELGFRFSGGDNQEGCFITVSCLDSVLTGVKFRVIQMGELVVDSSIAINLKEGIKLKSRLILQMLGSGLTLYMQDEGLPEVIGQIDYSAHIDLRKKQYINHFQSHLFLRIKGGEVGIHRADVTLTTGVGLADIRAITYENGDPLLDQGRLWYTMSIRGRALPHHVQGVFSMDPGVFDITLEGIVVFDRKDGLLRNEIASHIFYDRNKKLWRGITTGFSAYANLEKEKKQLLVIESTRDPRFGFSVMNALPFGMVGDMEDPHILYDADAEKWRMLGCVNQKGYKAVMWESERWNQDYKQIAGPVAHNSTGTSIQKIGNTLYCFSGSSEREIFIYSYPDLKEVGTLKMDLPPWDKSSGTRVWPNVVQLPEAYPFPYVALMMDRFNFPGLQGPHWSYGALYLYHGFNE